MGYLRRIVADSRGPAPAPLPPVMSPTPLFRGDSASEILSHAVSDGLSASQTNSLDTAGKTFENDPARDGTLIAPVTQHTHSRSPHESLTPTPLTLDAQESVVPRNESNRTVPPTAADTSDATPVDLTPEGRMDQGDQGRATGGDPSPSHVVPASQSRLEPPIPLPNSRQMGAHRGRLQTPEAGQAMDGASAVEPTAAPVETPLRAPHVITATAGPPIQSGAAPSGRGDQPISAAVRRPTETSAPPAAVIPRIGAEARSAAQMPSAWPMLESSQAATAPEVRIGKLDVFVQAPAGQKQHGRQAPPARDSSSRYRLRSL